VCCMRRAVLRGPVSGLPPLIGPLKGQYTHKQILILAAALLLLFLTFDVPLANYATRGDQLIPYARQSSNFHFSHCYATLAKWFSKKA